MTNKEYLIPKKLCDKKGIDRFLAANSDKQIIVVQGLGFVGAVMSIVCANSSKKEYAVIGTDIANSLNYWKIASINEGIFPVVASDPKVKEFYDVSKNKMVNQLLMAIKIYLMDNKNG